MVTRRAGSVAWKDIGTPISRLPSESPDTPMVARHLPPVIRRRSQITSGHMRYGRVSHYRPPPKELPDDQAR